MSLIYKGQTIADVGGAGGGSSEEIYSTEETRIGTWIDGKPLYRRVITGNLPNSLNVSSGGQHNLISAVPPQVTGVMDTVVSLAGRIQHGDLTRWYSFPYTSVTSSNTVAIDIMLTNGMNTSNEHRIYIGYACTVAGVLNYYTNDAYFIIVEYTKTTD